jgi:hypothetical protein
MICNCEYISSTIKGPAEKPDDFLVKIKLKVYYLFTQIYY